MLYKEFSIFTKKLLALLLLSPFVAGEMLEEDINLECEVILEQKGEESPDIAFIKIDSRPSRYGEGGKVTELDKFKYEEGDFNIGELNILSGQLKVNGSMPMGYVSMMFPYTKEETML